MRLRTKHKGSLIIEGMVGVFFIGITALVMVSLFGFYNKNTKRIKDFEEIKEIEALIVKEIKYNITYCEALALFNEEKLYPVNIKYYEEKVKNNMDFLREEGNIVPGKFRVNLVSSENKRLVFNIVSDITEEVLFYKYQIY